MARFVRLTLASYEHQKLVVNLDSVSYMQEISGRTSIHFPEPEGLNRIEVRELIDELLKLAEE